MLRSLFLVLCLLIGQATLFAEEAAIQSERTLAMIKPDAVEANHVGDIIARLEKSGLKVIALKMTKLTTAQAKEFYAVHKDRPFFNDLITFISRGPVVAMVLEGNDAVKKNREVMGATDPKKAAPGTIRADFAKSVTENAIHGSDSVENAKNEISFFFKPQEIYSR